MPTPRPKQLVPASALLAVLALLAPAGASARRTESGERRHHAARTSAEGAAPAESPPAGEGEVPVVTAPSDPPPTGESGRGSIQGVSPRGCRATVASTTTHILAGETVTLTGVLECHRGSAAGIVLPVLEHGHGELDEIGTATTGADGSYEMTTSALARNCTLLVRPAGGHGGHVRISVAPRVTLTAPAPEAQSASSNGKTGGARNRWIFSGVVDPAAVGTRIALQRESESAGSGERWHTFAFASVGAEGHFSLIRGFRSPGDTSVRAIAHIRGDAAAASEPVTVEVAQAQNPLLTIAASADPLSAGQALQISGVAANAANQQVTLLARTAGSAFVAVATATTDGSGGYSFSPTPVQDTAYRVSDAATQSTTLAEGVKPLLALTEPPRSLRAGEQFAFTGTLTPAAVGEQVLLERESSSGLSFHVIAVASVGAASSFSIPYSAATSATAILRIKVPASKDNEGTTSAPFSVAVSDSAAGEEDAEAAAG